MTNRGFTRAEMLHHTILTNRAASAPTHTCPECDGATRTALRGTELHRICRAACGWTGEYLAAETETARTALIERGEGHLIGGRA